MTEAIIQMPAHPNASPYRLGDVSFGRALDPAELNIPADSAPNSIISVSVTDPYLDAMPEEWRQEIGELEHESSEGARTRREDGLWFRQPGTAYKEADGTISEKEQWGDPIIQREFFNALDSEALDIWRSSVIPSARALAYLSDPTYENRIEDKHGKSAEIDDIARYWWTASSDAIGMRSRAAVMARVLADFAIGLDVQEKNGLNWTSVACGTALPAMRAAMAAEISPNLSLLDIDTDAMASTQRLGDVIGFDGDISQTRTNIFNAKRMKSLLEKTIENGTRPLVVDAMGIFEYTGDEINVDSAEFLRSIYNLTDDGGRLVFGQMRADRFDSDFTMGVVGWPYVSMRTPKALMEIVKKAGIPANEVDLYLPTDNVYTVGVISKPAVAKSSQLVA